jgi:glycosyltransferase involved in cell wall biosynthesis
MQTKLRVLYVHDQYLNTSKAHYHQIVDMCNAFTKVGCEVTLLLPRADKYELGLNMLQKSDLANRFQFNVEYRDVNFWHKIKRYIPFWGKSDLHEKFKPDLIFTRDPSSVPSCVKSGIKTVFETHNNKIHDSNWFKNTYWLLLLKWFCHNRDFYILTISEALRNSWIDLGFNSEKIFTFHDGFDVNRYDVEMSKEEARFFLNLSQESKYVVYTGSLYPDRNIGQILKLAQSIPDAIFLIAGGPEDQRFYYETESIRLGLRNIRFVGQINRDQIVYYTKSADVLLAIWSDKVPTINYCSPLKLFEYMASGRVIVAQSFPTIKEILIHGVNGFLANYNSQKDLVEKVKYALASPDSVKLANVAKHQAFKMYTWNVRAQGILKKLGF